jgi:hypothetical protein
MRVCSYLWNNARRILIALIISFMRLPRGNRWLCWNRRLGNGGANWVLSDGHAMSLPENILKIDFGFQTAAGIE